MEVCSYLQKPPIVHVSKMILRNSNVLKDGTLIFGSFMGLSLNFAGGRLLLAPSMMGLTWMHDR